VQTGFWWVNLREGDHLKDQRTDERIILNWIFKKWSKRVETGLIWLRWQTLVNPVMTLQVPYNVGKKLLLVSQSLCSTVCGVCYVLQL
jgi:hypothetical protein